MIYKTFIALLLFIFFTTFLFAQRAEAHVLKTDNAIGAILHIDPEDDPIAGKPSNFFFALKDKQNHFATTDCNCTITIKQNGKILTQQTTTADPQNKTTIIFTYTLPQKNIYEVILNGKPKNKNTFQSFSLTYDIRVDREKQETDKPQSTPLLMIILGSIIGGALLIIFWKNEKTIQYNRNNTSH